MERRGEVDDEAFRSLHESVAKQTRESTTAIDATIPMRFEYPPPRKEDTHVLKRRGSLRPRLFTVLAR
jgi:hypothetical protein